MMNEWIWMNGRSRRSVWVSTRGSVGGCTIWTMRWTSCAASSPTHIRRPCGSFRKSPRCSWPRTTSWCRPTLWMSCVGSSTTWTRAPDWLFRPFRPWSIPWPAPPHHRHLRHRLHPVPPPRPTDSGNLSSLHHNNHHIYYLNDYWNQSQLEIIFFFCIRRTLVVFKSVAARTHIITIYSTVQFCNNTILLITMQGVLCFN